MNSEKNEGMTDEQCLYPGEIYALNRLLREIWPSYELKPEDGKKNVVVAFSLFSKHSRTFHWLGLGKYSFQFVSDDHVNNDNKNPLFTSINILDGLRERAGENGELWKSFCENLATEILGFRKAEEYISDYIRDGGKSVSEGEESIFHQSLLALYEGYRHDPELYLDGIVLRNIKKIHKDWRHIGISHLANKLLYENENLNQKTYSESPWTEVTPYFMGEEEIPNAIKIAPFQCQEHSSFQDTMEGIPPLRNGNKDCLRDKDVIEFLRDKLFLEQIINQVQEQYNIEYKPDHILVLPVYDALIGGKYCGGIWGNLILFFVERAAWDDYKEDRNNEIRKLREITHFIVQELRHSAISEILTQPIVPKYNLIEHFVRNLRILQDWERIVVFRDKSPQYCYSWNSKQTDDNNNIPEWKRSEWMRCPKDRAGECSHCESWNQLEKEDWLFWKIDNIWNKPFIPDITDRQRADFGQIRFAFQYPLSSVLPKDKNDRRSLDELYIRQQLDVLRGLLPKFEERRSAIRSAASAILARNMSHNIGSHVTPRTRLEDLRGRIGEFFLPEAGDPRYWGYDEWRIGFNVLKELKDTLDEYEQRKAEFIAEFSTDPLISTREAWFYRDVVFPFLCNTALTDTLAANEGFHYKSADKPGIVIRCLREQPGGEPIEFRPLFYPETINPARIESLRKSREGQPPLIPYGLRTFGSRSSVHISSTDNIDRDIRVSLPGPVGEMAFYSILENLIRNAAKHGGHHDDRKYAGPMEIWIIIREPEGKDAGDEYYEIEIRENLSSTDTDTVGTINDHIKEPIVDDAGKVRNKAWGLAEMGLCTDLLRGQVPGVFQEEEGRLRVNQGHWAVSSDEKTESQKCLVYSLKVRKAWTAVFFGFEDVSDEERGRLRDGGFDFKPASALLDGNEDGMPSAFRFAVLDAKLVAEIIGNHKSKALRGILNRLPFRILVTGHAPDEKNELQAKLREKDIAGDGIAFAGTRLFEDENGKPTPKTSETLTRWLWREWLGFLGEKTGDSNAPLAVDVYFMQGENKQPTLDWKQAASKFSPPKKAIPARVRVWADDRDKGVHCVAGKEPKLDGERRIVIDRHGDFSENSDYSAFPENRFQKDRLIVIDKASSDFDTLYNASIPDTWKTPDKEPDESWELPFELAEAGLVRILLLDERIAQRAVDKFQEMGAGKPGFRLATTGSKDTTPLNWHIAERAGVYVVTHLSIGVNESALGLDSNPSDGKILDLAEGGWLKPEKANPGGSRQPYLELRFTAADNKKRPLATTGHGTGMGPWKAGGARDIVDDVDLVIIHQGILDRVREEYKSQEANMGETLLDALAKRCWVIVESGRGIPPEVQETNNKFLPFSLIERAFRGGRVAKLGLTRTVMAATRNKKS